MDNKNDTSGSKQNRIWDIFKILLAAGLLGYVITRTDFRQIASLGNRISLTWLVLSFALLCTLTVLKAVQYHYITGRKADYHRVLGIVVIQNALTNFVASTAGVASYVTMMGAEKDVRFGRATVSFLVAKLADLIAVFMLLLFSFLLPLTIPAPVLRISLIVCGIAVFILFVFFAVVIFRRKFVDFVKIVLHLIRVDHLRFIKVAVDLLVSLSEQDLSRILKMLAGSVGFSFLYMLVTMYWGYARLKMFSFNVDFSIVIVVTCLLQLASWVPVFVFGGLGISESIAVYLFGAFGLGQSETAAVLLAARLVFYLMNGLMLLYIPLENFFAKRAISS